MTLVILVLRMVVNFVLDLSAVLVYYIISIVAISILSIRSQSICSSFSNSRTCISIMCSSIRNISKSISSGIIHISSTSSTTVVVLELLL